MIKTFSCKETERIFGGIQSRKFPIDIQSRARLVLVQLDATTDIAQLRIPPSNRLHALSGNLKGFWSLSINKQYRVVFRWENGQATDVKITDYH